MDELRWALLLLGAIVVLAVYLYSRRQDSGSGDDIRGTNARNDRAEPVITGEDLWGPDEDEEGAAPGARQPPPSQRREVVSNAQASSRREPRLGDAAEARQTEEPVPASMGRSPAFACDAADRFDSHDPYGDANLDAIDDAVDSPHKEEGSTAELPQIETEPVITPDVGPPINPDKIIAMRMAARAGKLMAAETVVLQLRELGLRHGKFSIFHRHLPDGEGVPLFSVASMTEPGSFDLSKLRETQVPGVTLFMVLPGPVDPIQAFEEMVEAARAIARQLDGELLDESGSSWSIQRERYIREELIRYRLQHPQR